MSAPNLSWISIDFSPPQWTIRISKDLRDRSDVVAELFSTQGYYLARYTDIEQCQLLTFRAEKQMFCKHQMDQYLKALKIYIETKNEKKVIEREGPHESLFPEEWGEEIKAAGTKLRAAVSALETASKVTGITHQFLKPKNV